MNPLDYPWWVRLLFQLAARLGLLIGVVLIFALVVVVLAVLALGTPS